MSSDWHLDKRVPISIILTIAIQSAVLIWWAATLTARVDALEIRLMDHSSLPSHSDVNARLSRLDARQELLLDLVGEMRGDLETLREEAR